MQAPGRWTYGWPGLARLWGAGEWRGLATAAAFTILFNAALLASLTDWGGIGAAGQATLWIATAVFWLVSARNSHRWRQRLGQLPKQDDCDQRLVAAQLAYLRGHWPEAESMLRQLLEARSDDIEARLLLATLLRRMVRLQEARAELEDLSKRNGSERWALEFRREWELVQRPATAGAT